MPLRWRKSVKILPGIRLNLGPHSRSFSIGGRHVRTNISRRGVGNSYSLGHGFTYVTRRRRGCGCPLAALALLAAVALVVMAVRPRR